MKLVSTTLTGCASSIIGDALLSVVDYVDQCLVIDTGADSDTLRVARVVAQGKLVVRDLSWPNDFSVARNQALRMAAELGADWALTIDTDERLMVEPWVTLRSALEQAEEDYLLAPHRSGTYVKERVFKVPAKGQWVGPTHEAYIGSRQGRLPGVSFRELPKTPDQLFAKFTRDVELLTAHTRQHPQDPRWHYYLGASHHDLGHHREAIAAFSRCAELRGWPEEGAWACFRAAECHMAMGEFKEAIDVCARGLAIRPGTSELAWLAGTAALSLSRYEDAVAWATMAAATGQFCGSGAQLPPRIGFCNLPALYESPYNVLHQAYSKLGLTELAEASQLGALAAKEAREGA